MDRVTARVSSRFLSYGLPYLYLITSIAFYLHTYDSAQVKMTEYNIWPRSEMDIISI